MPEKHVRKQAKLTPEMEAKKWKPGQSGNPKGRKKNTEYYPDLIRKYCDKPIPPKFLSNINKFYPEIKSIGHKESLILLAYIYAYKGNQWAFNFLVERDEGKLKESEIVQTLDLKEFAAVIRNNYESE